MKKIKKLNYGMPQNRKNNILELLDCDIKNKKILDVGCSSGYFGKYLEKKGAKVTGIDISHDALKIASRSLTQTALVNLNTHKIPFKDSKFDIVVASEVIEHLLKPLITLKEISRVMKDNGYLIVTTPNIVYWGNRLKFLKGNFRYTQVGVFDETHVHFYTYKTLIDDLKEAGFVVSKENNIYANKFLKFLYNFAPSFFAYQFVILAKKSS